ncbi:MAG: hypothetical protein IT446_04475 [Phycisphaerales bacterium]|nr:hypothetical protein [Phycisphaerales bacterium]
MKKRISLAHLIVIGAVLAYGVVIGCVMAPAGQPSATAPSTHATASTSPFPTATTAALLPFRGAGFQIQRVDWMDKYKQSIDEIAAIGGDTVLMVVDTRQENGTSSRIYLDMRMTPTADQLGGLILHAKEKKLRVILMPIVLLDKPRGNEWRGTLKPESWADWWESYRSMISHFSWIAQGYGVDVLVVGSELVSTEQAEHLNEWTKTIQLVRSLYKGRLTYSANWDHYTAVKFWDQLDLMGLNSYYKLGEDRDVTVPQIQFRWSQIQQDLIPFSRKIGKPLLFLEVGWCSLANAASEPWDYTKTEEPVDLELQKKLYEGFFQSWYANPYLGGFMIWEWTPGDGGPEDKGYTPENKPAEAVLRQWLQKPRWQVKAGD